MKKTEVKFQDVWQVMLLPLGVLIFCGIIEYHKIISENPVGISMTGEFIRFLLGIG